MKVLVYISGKYTSKTKKEVERNIRVAEKAAVKIWESGGAALTPHLNTAHFDCKATYDDYIQGDIQLLEGCDVIYMLPDWKTSKGANIEYNHAKANNIPIFTEMSKLIAFLKKKHIRCEVSNRIRTKYTKIPNVGLVDSKIYPILMKIAQNHAKEELSYYKKNFILLPKN